MVPKAPISDAIITAIAHLFDAPADQWRNPSHKDIESQIQRSALGEYDPKLQSEKTIGKRRRVYAVLSQALENNPVAGQHLAAGLIAQVKGCGGFRAGSEHFVGEEAIQNAAGAFKTEGFELSTNGELYPRALDSLSGVQLTDALKSYVRRAQQGIEDAALVTGTGKDLLEATAAHVLVEKYGRYPETSNFPTLLGQAFAVLDLATPADTQRPNEPAQKRFERAMYELGCAINKLRNKQGTGHGRPWLSTVTQGEAKVALEHMGAIADRMLQALLASA